MDLLARIDAFLHDWQEQMDRCGYTGQAAEDMLYELSAMVASMRNPHSDPHRVLLSTAEAIDFAIDITEPRDVRLGRFQAILREFEGYIRIGTVPR